MMAHAMPPPAEAPLTMHQLQLQNQLQALMQEVAAKDAKLESIKVRLVYVGGVWWGHMLGTHCTLVV